MISSNNRSVLLPGENGLHFRDGSLTEKKKQQWQKEKEENLDAWFPFGNRKAESATKPKQSTRPWQNAVISECSNTVTEISKLQSPLSNDCSAKSSGPFGALEFGAFSSPENEFYPINLPMCTVTPLNNSIMNSNFLSPILAPEARFEGLKYSLHEGSFVYDENVDRSEVESVADFFNDEEKEANRRKRCQESQKLHEESVLTSIERAEIESKALKRAKVNKHRIFDDDGKTSLKTVHEVLGITNPQIIDSVFRQLRLLESDNRFRIETSKLDTTRTHQQTARHTPPSSRAVTNQNDSNNFSRNTTLRTAFRRSMSTDRGSISSRSSTVFEEKADKVAINQKKLEHLHKPDPSTFKRISNIAEASEDNNRSAEAIARRNETYSLSNSPPCKMQQFLPAASSSPLAGLFQPLQIRQRKKMSGTSSNNVTPATVRSQTPLVLQPKAKSNPAHVQEQPHKYEFINTPSAYPKHGNWDNACQTTPSEDGEVITWTDDEIPLSSSRSPSNAPSPTPSFLVNPLPKKGSMNGDMNILSAKHISRARMSPFSGKTTTTVNAWKERVLPPVTTTRSTKSPAMRYLEDSLESMNLARDGVTSRPTTPSIRFNFNCRHAQYRSLNLKKEPDRQRQILDRLAHVRSQLKGSQIEIEKTLSETTNGNAYN